MAKMRDMVVVAVTWKGVNPGSRNWASVYDAPTYLDAMDWIKEKKGLINHAAITREGDFRTYQEKDLFKSMLKSMLNLEGGYVGNEEEQEWFCDIEMEMKHFFEKDIREM